ncbi:MAG: putative integral rane protein [Cyanobacteria bacterium RYN_339]|nr:putative integral rane protein [Cyanobacteria bacterium RYN_339]
MTLTVIWMILFVALVVIETYTLEFTCLSIAFGCLLAGTAAWLALPIGAQLLIAAIGSASGVALIAPVLRKRVLPQDSRTGTDLIVGSNAEVVEAIYPPAQGKVKLDGVIWQAESDRPLEVGAHVLVTELQGARLTVMARPDLEGPRAQLNATQDEIQRSQARQDLH